MKYLEGWVFIYNPFDEKFMGTTAENYILLKNDYTNPKVLRTSNFSSLQSLIIKAEGDLDKALKLLK